MSVSNKLEILNNIVSVVDSTFSIYNELDMDKANSRRRWWVRPVNVSREEQGFFKLCIQQIEEKDEEHFYLATRMSVSQYKLLLTLIRPKLEKHSARKPISPECRLTLTLLFLAHGCSVQVLAWAYKIGICTVRNVVYETCEVIWEELHQFYMSVPNKTDWIQISSSFYQTSGLPHCLGAIDGKHVNIKCPKKSGSLFFNYKKHFSIVLMAVCDHNYAFTFVDVGAYGSQSDGGIFRKSVFGRKIINNNLGTPAPNYLPNSNIRFPFYFIGDNAFPLLPNLMRPYPGTMLSDEKRHFNKTLSKARCRIEIAFGILANRWRILHTTINSSPENAQKIILAAALLHNFLILNNDRRYFNNEDLEEISQQNLDDARILCSNRSKNEAFGLRETLKEYLFTHHSVTTNDD